MTVARFTGLLYRERGGLASADAEATDAEWSRLELRDAGFTGLRLVEPIGFQQSFVATKPDARSTQR